eukprot:scaffold7537_cov179-Ochromonas_danica.AAC.4
MLFLTLLFVTLAVTLATYGVDVSQATSTSSFSCLKSNGYSFAIVRVYRSSGSVDPNGPSSINNAWNGGMAHVDGYIFPCYSCGNPAKQMDDTVSYLRSHNFRLGSQEGVGASANSTLGATVGMLWIDVEGTDYWSSSTSNNVNFIQSMVNEGKNQGISLGIYSSASQWKPITGDSHQFSSLPIWYAHYDNNPSYSDWASFGGWTKPAIKQYAGTTSICSTSVDKNYY